MLFPSKNLRVDPSLHQSIRRKFYELRQKTPPSVQLSFIRFSNLIVTTGLKAVLECFSDEQLIAFLAGQNHKEEVGASMGKVGGEEARR